MTVASGVRPYNYSRYPFILNEGEIIGTSGILFEEAMFVVLAERDILTAVTGTNRHYYKYFGNGGPDSYTTRVGFEPRADGGNLDGSWLYPVTEFASNPLALLPGCVNFKDYILDMRTNLELLFSTISSLDSDASATEIKNAHLSGVKLTHFPALIQYSGTDYLHNQTQLGESGVFYDVDLREVQWQPLLRFGKYKDTESKISPASPICPSFQNTLGSLITVYPRDLTITAAAGGILEEAYNAASSGSILILGDAFLTSSRAYMFDLWSDKKDGGTLVCNEVSDRSNGLNLTLTNGYGKFTPAAASSGIKRLFLYQTDTSVALPSSLLSFWPHRESGQLDALSPSRNTGYTISNDVIRTSGLQVFNDYFACINNAGVRVMSPLNSDVLWTRHGDTSTWTITSAYSTSHSGQWNVGGFNGTEYATFNLFNTNIGGGFTDIEIYVVTWDIETLDLIGVTKSGPWTKADTLISTFGIIDVSQHLPATGASVASYTLCPCREGSDNVGSTVIWDGSNTRGLLFSNMPNTTSPDPRGTVNGEIFGEFPGDTRPRFLHMRIDASYPTFPLPASSGFSIAGSFEMDRGYFEIRYDPDTIGHDFQPPTYALGDTRLQCTSRIVQPTGYLDTGDGSALIQFTAKRVGEATAESFIGRIEMATSGGTEYLRMIEYWGPVADSLMNTYGV